MIKHFFYFKRGNSVDKSGLECFLILSRSTHGNGGSHCNQNPHTSIQITILLCFAKSKISEYFLQFGIGLCKVVSEVDKPRRAIAGNTRCSYPLGGSCLSVCLIIYRFQPSILVGFRITFDGQMRKPTVRGGSMPMHYIRSYLHYISGQ